MTTKQIFEAMRARQADLLHLSGVLDAALEYEDYISEVNSGSRVADHSHWLYLFAYESYLLEQRVGELKAEVSSLADTAEIGTAAWWDRVVREFQVFDSPVVVGSKTTYAVLDPTKQIVKRVAVKQDASGTVVIKVAKEVGGSLEPLDDATGNDEIGSLESYLISRQPFGVDFLLVNLAADKLRVYATVYYHPVLDIDSVKEAVDQAIKGYIAALSFDGKVYVRRLTDAIQLAAGVRDVSPVVISGSSGSLSVSTDQVYETASGHVVEDPDVLFLSTLQFEPFEP